MKAFILGFCAVLLFFLVCVIILNLIGLIMRWLNIDLFPSYFSKPLWELGFEGILVLVVISVVIIICYVLGSEMINHINS